MKTCADCGEIEQDWQNTFTEVDAESGKYECLQCNTETLADKCRAYRELADKFYGGKE